MTRHSRVAVLVAPVVAVVAVVAVSVGPAVSQPVAASHRAGPIDRAPLARRPTRARETGRARPAGIRLTAVDPGYSYGIQVGDTVTLTAVVHDPNVARPVGTVTFRADDRYDHCPLVRLRRTTTARCYLTFYSPGRFFVTASYKGRDRSVASVTLRFSVVPATND